MQVHQCLSLPALLHVAALVVIAGLEAYTVEIET